MVCSRYSARLIALLQKNLIKRRTSSDRMAFALLVIYPVWFLWPALRLNTSIHFGLVGNDINYSIQEAQVLSRMHTPWSQTNFYSFPDYSYFWRIEHLVDIPQKTFYWMATRILEPVISVTLYQLLGHVALGFVTYKICRKLEIPLVLSTASGFIAQVLPTTRQLMLTGAAAHFVAIIPLCAIYCICTYLKQSNPKLLRALPLLFLLAGVSSIYALNYTGFIVLILFVFDFKVISARVWKLTRIQRGYLVTSLSFLLCVGYLLGKYLLSKTVSEYGSPYGIYSLGEVQKDPYSLMGFISPDKFHLLHPSSYWEDEGYSQQYTGLIICVGALAGVLLAGIGRVSRSVKFLIVATIALVIVSLGEIRIGSLVLPAARDYLRFIMIGNRRYAIAGYISQFMIVILFVYALNRLRTIVRVKLLFGLAATLTLALAIVDVNPLSRRYFYAYAERYSEIRDVLNSDQGSAIYVSPTSERQLDYFVLDYPVYRNHVGVFASAARGPDELANYLLSQGVRYVLVLVNEQGSSYITGYIQNSFRMTVTLPDKRFSPLTSDLFLENTNDKGEVEREWKIRLVKVLPDKDLVDIPRDVLAQYVMQPILEVSNPEIDRTMVSVEWATSPSLGLSTEALPSDILYERPPDVEFIADLVPPPGNKAVFEVTLSSSYETKSISLLSAPMPVKIRAKMYETIKIVTNSPCQARSDGTLGALSDRPLCFGISNFAVLQMPE